MSPDRPPPDPPDETGDDLSRADPRTRAATLRLARKAAAPPAQRVLVIDDDEEDRHVIARALRKARPEIEIIEAGSALEGLDRLEADDPSLVLLDLRMAGADGFAVLSAAKTGKRRPEVPVVVLSTSDNPDDVRRAYRLHANAYVQKPATMDEYERLARRLVDFWIETAMRP
jgi:CheY-like chemotaxis protein